jgi:hypothetical protein
LYYYYLQRSIIGNAATLTTRAIARQLVDGAVLTIAVPLLLIPPLPELRQWDHEALIVLPANRQHPAVKNTATRRSSEIGVGSALSNVMVATLRCRRRCCPVPVYCR